MKDVEKLNIINNQDNWYVCSLIVQARPEKMEQVKKAILALPGTEIHAEKIEDGKLVVVMEASHQPELANKIDKVKDISGVIVVSLIYNYLDEQN
ncbi:MULTISPECIES: chaperone NapD [Pasteurellaceae]|uniref:Chaperone NapD n=1 Tax=Pasteurella bettyae CCUG 2042 TaxID=1095749 RepID=I3DBS5_9PAST|nr:MULTISPECIES: chaperone NapD [Pasteurellaceae]EIJ69168.1 NapD protein [Pasteurella bettyae CCUG 2042]SUB22835.1 protein NapD [Pasteurella bettyae]